MVDSDQLHVADPATAYVREMNHESPQLKFPAGFPRRGDAVKVFVNWDVCLKRGKGKHRPLAKLVLRVKPISNLRDGDAEIHILNVRPLFADDFRPLHPICLNATQARDWWMIRICDAETRELAEKAIAPQEAPQQAEPEYPQYAEILMSESRLEPPLLPASPITPPSWQDDLR